MAVAGHDHRNVRSERPSLRITAKDRRADTLIRFMSNEFDPGIIDVAHARRRLIIAGIIDDDDVRSNRWDTPYGLSNPFFLAKRWNDDGDGWGRGVR